MYLYELTGCNNLYYLSKHGMHGDNVNEQLIKSSKPTRKKRISGFEIFRAQFNSKRDNRTVIENGEKGKKGDYGKILGNKWKNLSETEKKVFLIFNNNNYIIFKKK